MRLNFFTIKPGIFGIWDHVGFQRYFKNTGWLFFGRIFSLAVSFFIGVWLARYLGPEKYGILNYSIAFVGIFAFISTLGLDGILFRELVTNKDKNRELLGTASVLSFFGGVFALILTVFFIFLFEPSAQIRLFVVLYSFTFIANPIALPISYYYQSSVQAKKNVLVAITSAVVVSILKVILILLSLDLVWFLLIYLLEAVLSVIFYIFVYKKDGFKIFSWKFDKKIAKSFIYSSWLLMFAGAFSYIYMKIDQVMIRFFFDEVSVGLYAVAVRLSEVWFFVPSMICASLFPAIVNAKKNNIVYRERLKKLFFLLISLSVFIAFITTLLAKPLVSILFGKLFFESIDILRIYVWSGVGLFTGVAIYHYFLSEKKIIAIFFYNFLSMLINVVLNIILMSKIGLTGAAWATLISYSVGPILVFFLLFFLNKYRHVPKKNI